MRLQHKGSKLKGRSCSTAESLLHLHTVAVPRTVEVSQERPEWWKTGKTALTALSIHAIDANCDFDVQINWDLIIMSTALKTSKMCFTRVCPWLTKLKYKEPTHVGITDTTFKHVTLSITNLACKLITTAWALFENVWVWHHSKLLFLLPLHQLS